MAAEEAVLGLDTSCYTTSAALMDLHGHLLGDQRRLLRVKPGHRGLAQSEMVFQHTRNLPDLLEALDLSGVQVKAVGVSAKPRPREESSCSSPPAAYLRCISCATTVCCWR